jgi:ABC-2 type transport system permease protein
VSTRTLSLRGTGPLTRFAFRRDRVRVVVWIASIVLLVFVTIGSIKGLYPTQHDLDIAAAASEDNAAAIIFNGPVQGLNTAGGQVAFQTGTFGLILVGLMNMFVLGRMTRGEEESGRTELLRSLPIGARALPAAALITVASMNLMVGAGVALSCIATDLPATGSLVFGLSFAVFGLFMAAFTLAAAQVTENTRVVYGLGGVVLGVAFVLRAIGDVGNGAISWLSPIGWAQKTRPFAGEAWWPFLVIIGVSALLAWLAASLSLRRDLGAGLVAPRAGRAHAAPSLGTPIGLATRLQRGSFVGWTAGLISLGVAYGSVADSINDFVKDNDSLSDIIAAQGSGTLLEQYMAMSFRILALIAAGFAIQSALRLRSEETTPHAEPVLATPVSRARWATSHLAIAFGGTVLIMFLTGFGFGVADAAVTGDAGAIGHSIVAAVAFTPAIWILVGVTVALIGFAPKFTLVSWAILGACFVIGFFGQVLNVPRAVEELSPFQRVPQYPAADFDVVPLAALTAIAAVFTAAGFAGLRRRDIG